MMAVSSEPAASTDLAISIRGLTKRYGERAVVDDLSLDVRRGEIVALLGPNGAGKTTTVEILEGYRQSDGGEVRVLGLDPRGDAPSLRLRVGLMLQSGGVYAYGRPRELLHLFAAFYATPADPDALLDQVGLAEVASRPYRVLSGGERQRLSLALALVGRPELVLLDEPTAGMDPAVRAATRALIGGLRSDGVTVLLTTHDLGDVEALADRVAIIARGRLLAEGPPVSVAAAGTADGGTDLVVTFSRPLTADEADSLQAAIAGLSSGAAATAEGDARIRIAGATEAPNVTAAVASWAVTNALPIAALGSGRTSLEARYLALVGRDVASEAESVPILPSGRRSRGAR